LAKSTTRPTPKECEAAAEARLGGAWYGTRYHYHDDETRAWYSVTRAEVRLFGQMLLDGKNDAWTEIDEGCDAYSEWCAATPSRDVSRFHA